ncbi:MAG: chromosomal replication initiator protein DnaA, partial [Porphyromonadaceae bacterium]|nr:chromosomal replication initiator protein DnaA [Porphyromonadaceae bacterium]
YKTWFEPIQAIDFSNDELTIQVPSHFFCEYLDEHFADILNRTLSRVCGPNVKLMYSVEVVRKPKETVVLPIGGNTYTEKSVKGNSEPVQIDPFKQPPYKELDSQLNPCYTFDNYFEGTSNALARSSGEAVALNPGKTTFNPLFLYGESGVGKTHLVQAIGAKAKSVNPRARVLYISSHLFQVQYTNAVRNNTVNDFINFYQSIDVLLIDDIQDLVGKSATQNTFFHIFNHLHQLGKQLVLTSDRAPVSLEGMEERLLTRFKWGLSAEVERPDYELRRRILLNKLKREGIVIAPDVIDFIAQNVQSSIRELEGIVVSLIAHSVLLKREISLELAERVLASSVQLKKRQITIDLIQQKVCAYYHMDVHLLQSKTRKREIALARQISMYLAKKYTDSPLAHIGSRLGGKDHATVHYACKMIAEQVELDKTLRAQIAEIEQSLKS